MPEKATERQHGHQPIQRDCRESWIRQHCTSKKKLCQIQRKNIQLSETYLLLTLSFSRFTTHLLASSAILEKRPMGVSFMTHLSLHTFLRINHLNYVFPLQAITSVRDSTMRLTKVTWRTVGSPLTMKESARRPVRMCAAAGRSQLTCYSTREGSGSRTWHKNTKMAANVDVQFEEKMATILAPSTVKEMDASRSLYQPDSLWWPSSLRPFQRKWQEVAKCNEWRPAGTGAASAAPYWSHRDEADVGERPLDVRPLFSQLVSNGNMVVSYK